MKFFKISLICLLFSSCGRAVNDRTQGEIELLKQSPLEMRVFLESCTESYGFAYCIERYYHPQQESCAQKETTTTTTGDIATGVGLGIVGGHLIKKVLR